MRLSYINKLDDYELVASNAAIGYPIINVQQEHLSLKWRTVGTSGTILMDSTDLNPNCAFIAGTNLSSSAIVKIQGNNTDIWTSPSVEIVLENNNGVSYTFSDNFSAMRYWRFSIEDGSNIDGYIELGRAWIGEAITVSVPYISFVEKRINTSEATISISGQPYGDVGYVYRSWEMSYPYWDNTEKANIEIFADYVNKSLPFFTQFTDDNNCILGPFYVIMTNNIDMVHLKSLNIWSSKLSFREVK